MHDAGEYQADNPSVAQGKHGALVHVRFLGSLEIRLHGAPVSFPTRHAALLFAYLAAHPGVPRTRSHLGALFWGDRGEEQARASLRQTIFRIRRSLGSTEAQVISADAQTIAVMASTVSSDLDDLDQHADTDPPGEFLSGWDGLSTDLDVWIKSERVRVNEALHGILSNLAIAAENQGAYQRMAAYARRMLLLDPYDETAAQRSMKALAMTGNAAAATEVFRGIRDRLEQELGLEPSEETRTLAAEIAGRTGRFGHRRETRAPGDERASLLPDDPVRELRTVTVVSAWAQPRGGESTASPEQVLQIRQRCEPAFNAVLKRHGGTADRAPGLISVSYFGWPIPSEDAGRQAVDAAIAFQQITTCRIGISTGEILIEPGLDPIGAPPDDAFDLMSRAARGETLISDATRTLIGARYELAGTDHGAARVLGPARLPERFSARDEIDPAMLIGRDQERDLLRDRMRRADAGEGQLVIVSGEPGIGKSRLQEEVAREAATRDARRILLQCKRTGQGTPFQPVMDHIAIAAGVAQFTDRAPRLRRLQAHLEEAGVVDQAHVLAISDLLGLVDTVNQSGEDQAAPNRRRAALLGALAAYFLSAEGNWLTFVVLEDAHWADPSTLELLEHLTARLDGSRLLILVTARPEFDTTRFPARFRTDLSLNALGRAEAARLVRACLPSGDGDARIVDRILDLTDGVPLFVEQMARWYAAHPDDLESIAGDRPLTLRAVLETRLARLGIDRRVAQRAACIGRQFNRATLLDACAYDPKDVDQALAEMLRSRLVFRYLGASGEEFSFTHALVADTAYESLPEDERKETHARILASPSAAEALSPAARARQADLAGRHEDAMALYRQAGDLTLSEFAHQEASVLFGKALAQFPHLHFSEGNEDARVDIMGKLSRCSAHALGYNHPRTAELLNESQRLAVSRPSAPAAIPILWQTYSLHYTQGDGAKTCEVGRRVLSLRAWNPEFGSQEALGNRFLAGGHMLQGEFAKAEAAFSAASEALQRIKAPSSVRAMGIDQLIPIGMLRARVLAILGREREALDLTDLTLGTAERLQLAQPKMAASVLAAQTLVILGDFSRAHALATVSLDLARKERSAMWEAYSRCIVGIAMARDGDADGSREVFQAGRTSLTQSNTIVSTTILDAVFAAELARLGIVDAATDRFSSAMDFVAAGGEPWSAPEVARLDLQFNALTHRHDAASFQKAKADAETLAQRQGAVLWCKRLAALEFRG